MTPGSGRSPEEGNGSPLQYYCLENPMDRGAWETIVHGVTKSQTRLSDSTLPGCSAVKNPPTKQETWVQSLVREDPLKKEMAAHSSTLA